MALFRKKGDVQAEAEAAALLADSEVAPDGAEVVTVATPAATRVAARVRGGGGVQLNLHLPPETHRRLRLASVRRGQTLAEVLAGLVAEHLPPE